jgi:putative spermidine/putrescine transport system substrate-binding protein
MGLVATAALAGAWLAGTAVAQDSVTVSSWGGAYQEAESKAVFAPTAKELNITIKEDTLTGLPDVRVQVEAGAVNWDIAELSSFECVTGAKSNLFEKLDYSVIDKDGIDPKIATDHWIAGAIYYSTVLAWNKSKFKDNPPKTWADFWDVEKYPGKRAMWNQPATMLELALMADGVAPDKLYPLDIERAFKKMRELKPHIAVWWTSGAQSAQILKDKEVEMVAIWNGRVSTIIKDGADADFTFNQGLLDFNCLTIPRGSKRVALAQKTIAKFLTPDIQANIPKYIDYGPVNLKAFDTGKIAAGDAPKICSSPENAAIQATLDPFWWGENLTKVQEMWDEMIQE